MRCREMRQLKDSWCSRIRLLKPASSAPEDIANTRDEEEENGEGGGEGGLFRCFDAVLVDAQCTHDSSYRHLRYLSDETSNSSREPCPRDVMWSNKCRSYKNIDSVASDESVYALQRDLLARGFSCLAPGGELVYSTCSAEHEQNEDIVQWLLDKEKDNVEVVPVVDSWCSGYSSTDYLANESDSDLFQLVKLLSAQPIPHSEILNFLRRHLSSDQGLERFHLLSDEVCRYAASFHVPPGREGRLAGTAYFGMWACTSGLFVSRIRKVHPKSTPAVRTEET